MANQAQPRLMLDTTNVSYEVSINAVPKLDQNRAQKIDRMSGLPMWSVVLYALGEGWAGTMEVTVTNRERPTATVRQPVIPVDLEALPWTNERDGKTRSGVAFKATDLQVIEVPALATA
jgi:hypothetical protein